MIVKQVSVFVENTVGRLADLTKILTDSNNIDLKASTIAETVDFGILRCIVEDPEKTVKILVENGFSASISEVTGVSLEEQAGVVCTKSWRLAKASRHCRELHLFHHQICRRKSHHHDENQ